MEDGGVALDVLSFSSSEFSNKTNLSKFGQHLRMDFRNSTTRESVKLKFNSSLHYKKIINLLDI